MDDGPASSGSVLVVEDEVFVAAFLEQALRKFGFNVVGPFGTVSAALDAIQDPLNVIDLALLDVALTEDETSEPISLELDRRDIPYVILTGDEAALDAFAAPHGACAVLGKPVPLARLMSTIGEVLSTETSR